MKQITLTKMSPRSADRPMPTRTGANMLLVGFVGSGNAFTKPGGRGETNLVLVHRDQVIGLDFGRRWPEAIGGLGLTRANLTALAVSHCHGDHVGSLGTLAQMFRYLDKRKPKIILPDELEPHLWGETLRGGLAHDTEPPSILGDYFEVVRPEQINDRTCRVKIGELDIELFRTHHAPANVPTWRQAMPSYGIYVPAFRLWVSMDSRYDEDLIYGYAARGASWFFHDAGRGGCPVHASIEQLGGLPPSIRKNLIAMHLPDDIAESEIAGFAGAANAWDVFALQPNGYED